MIKKCCKKAKKKPGAANGQMSDCYVQGRHKFEKEFNILSVMKTLQKLKAVVQVLIETNQLDIDKVNEKDFENSTIYLKKETGWNQTVVTYTEKLDTNSSIDFEYMPTASPKKMSMKKQQMPYTKKKT